MLRAPSIGCRQLGGRQLGGRLLGLLLVLTAPALAKKSSTALEEALWIPVAEGWTLTVPVNGEVWSGYREGLGLRPEAGAVVGFETRIRPRLRSRKGLRVDSDLRYSQRDGVDAAFAERRFRGGLTVSYPVLGSTRASATGQYRRVSRPGWLDLYQPDPGSAGQDWLTTDRYGYSTYGGSVAVDHTLSKRLKLGLSAGVRDRTAVQDPNFDGILDPNHLTPTDRRRWVLKTYFSGRSRRKIWRYRTGLSLAKTDWRYRFSRDAGTGKTHAGPGGEPANPLYGTRTIRLRHRSSFWLKAIKARLIATGGLARVEDLSDGYYTGDDLELGLLTRVRPVRGVVVSMGGKVRWRRYGEDSYAEGGSHPALDDGTRRVSRRVEANARLAYAFWSRRVTVFGEGSRIWRETNFPDYTPRVYPAARDYRIDWDADTWQMRVGLSFKVDP